MIREFVFFVVRGFEDNCEVIICVMDDFVRDVFEIVEIVDYGGFDFWNGVGMDYGIVV